MKYFIVTFEVVIDSTKKQNGSIGNISPLDVCQQGLIKETISSQYKRHYPHARNIEVTITEVKNVLLEEYKKLSKNLMEIS